MVDEGKNWHNQNSFTQERAMKTIQIEQLGGLENSALFFDIDGTLAPIAPTAECVVIDRKMLEILDILATRVNGALAILTGRPLAQCDKLFAPRLFAVAAEHGAIIRDLKGLTTKTKPPVEVESMYQRAQRELEYMPGVFIEKKHAGIALHYRMAPKLKEKVCRTAQEICAQHIGIVPLHGKMVVELKSCDVDKGSALRTLLAEPEFKGRRPLFFGDDVTDEPAFAMVQASGGIGIKIGPERSSATYSLLDQADLEPLLRQWCF